MNELYEAILVAQSGERERARGLFEAILPKLGDDAAQKCILAHYMADVQEDLEEELRWDLESLRFLEQARGSRVAVLETTLEADEFYPSVYLNIANDYQRLGDPDQALRYLQLAEDCCAILGDDGYGRFLRSRIALLGVEVRTRSHL